jgi:excinuclease UvrABC nuclease subunit
LQVKHYNYLLCQFFADEHVIYNVEISSEEEIRSLAKQSDDLYKLKDLLEFNNNPKRNKVYGNGNISGQHAIRDIIVAAAKGFQKKGGEKV